MSSFKATANSDHNSDPATQFYRDRMHSYLKQSNIPPTEWELNLRHESIHQETLSRFGGNSNTFEDRIQDAYAQVKRNHKELRRRSLIESVLGR